VVGASNGRAKNFQISFNKGSKAMLIPTNAITSVPGVDTFRVAASQMPESGKMTGAPAPFADLITDAVGQVDQLEGQAQAAVSGLMTGSGVDVHQAVIATEKASMAFELTLAVRNKAVQAYQSVMGMQF
jgi:flagellar hook-basal body complex protein FliE